jgi:short-subunit dehydrogenase
LAEVLSAGGASIILSGRNEAALREAQARCKTPTLILPFEATDYARIPALAEQAWSWAEKTGGAIHGLVNNAGISQRSLAVDTVFDVYQKIVAVDLLAPIALTQALLPRMVKAGGGQIIAISSVAGLVGAPLRSAYSAAKHGLIGYHDSVRAETAHQGIKVLVVAPGSVLAVVVGSPVSAVAPEARLPAASAPVASPAATSTAKRSPARRSCRQARPAPTSTSCPGFMSDK